MFGEQSRIRDCRPAALILAIALLCGCHALELDDSPTEFDELMELSRRYNNTEVRVVGYLGRERNRFEIFATRNALHYQDYDQAILPLTKTPPGTRPSGNKRALAWHVGEQVCVEGRFQRKSKTMRHNVPAIVNYRVLGPDCSPLEQPKLSRSTAPATETTESALLAYLFSMVAVEHFVGAQEIASEPQCVELPLMGYGHEGKTVLVECMSQGDDGDFYLVGVVEQKTGKRENLTSLAVRFSGKNPKAAKARLDETKSKLAGLFGGRPPMWENGGLLWMDKDFDLRLQGATNSKETIGYVARIFELTIPRHGLQSYVEPSAEMEANLVDILFMRASTGAGDQ